MPIKQDDKLLIIGELENTRTKASRLIISLMFAGMDAEAAAAQQKVEELGAQIDGLLAVAMREWSGGAAAFIADMKSVNQLLQRDITDIRKRRDAAAKVVNALGRLDDVITKVKDLLAKI